jgi:hypothetical protein
MSAIPQAQEVHATVLAAAQTRKVLELCLSPIGTNISRTPSLPITDAGTCLQDVPHIGYPLPIPFSERECRPRDFLFDATIMADCCNGTVEGVSGLQEQIDWLGAQCLSIQISRYH